MTYTIKLDVSARKALLSYLASYKAQVEKSLVEEFDEDLANSYEELNQLHRGVLFVRPDPEEVAEEAPEKIETNDG